MSECRAVAEFCGLVLCCKTCEEERVATWTFCTPCFAKTDCSWFMKTLFWQNIQADKLQNIFFRTSRIKHFGL